jgi:Na+/H+ antiporter NhaC
MPSKRWTAAAVLLATTWLLAQLGGGDSLLLALWPAIVSIGAIILLRQAVLGLALGVAAGALLLAGGDPVAALRLALTQHVFPAMQGQWRVGALVFTLVLGAFAGILESSGGFEALLRRMLAGTANRTKRLLGGVYAVGLLCFFDGLASSLLTGRMARPLADRAGISREKLAWVVDTTSSPVACVAFISTWIATQLSLIAGGLEGAPFQVDPYLMFFRSIPANPYCLLSLMIVPLAIWRGYEPAAMRRFKPVAPDAAVVAPEHLPHPRVVLIPLLVLVVAIMAGFPLLTAGPVNIATAAGWREAFSGDAGPYALVAGSIVGLVAAFAFFPQARRHLAPQAAVLGAGSLLPALLILILAWALGSQFQALGAADQIAALLSSGPAPAWLALTIFFLGAAMSFSTGSSWGTMGILMPLALPVVLATSAAAGMPAAEVQTLAAMVIGAVFGGATLGDHCSPFSDTTIVSAMASGCRTLDHVTSQLPFAALTAAAAAAAYSLMATGLKPWIATLCAALALAAGVARLAARAKRAFEAEA